MRAGWRHSQRSPLLALALSADGSRLVAVAESEAAGGGGGGGREGGGGGGGGAGRGEVESHCTRSWRLLSTRTVRHCAAEALVSADLAAEGGGGEEGAVAAVLLRPSGTLHRLLLSPPAPEGGEAAELDASEAFYLTLVST